MANKICKTCLTDKDLSDYYDGSAKYGKHSSCIDCVKIKANERHKINRNADTKDKARTK